MTVTPLLSLLGYCELAAFRQSPTRNGAAYAFVVYVVTCQEQLARQLVILTQVILMQIRCVVAHG